MQIRSEPFSAAERRRIFVIEPDEVIRSALYFILRDGDEAHAFPSLDQALAKAADRTPDVLLLGMSIVRSCGERIFADLAGRFPDAGMLLVADSVADPLAQLGLKRGAHDVLGKPITSDKVRDKVDVLLGRRTMRTPPPGQLAAAAM